MVEDDALGVRGNAGVTMICLEYCSPKRRCVGVQVLEIPVPIDTRNSIEVIDAKHLGRLRLKGHIVAAEILVD